MKNDISDLDSKVSYLANFEWFTDRMFLYNPEIRRIYGKMCRI